MAPEPRRNTKTQIQATVEASRLASFVVTVGKPQTCGSNLSIGTDETQDLGVFEEAALPWIAQIHTAVAKSMVKHLPDRSILTHAEGWCKAVTVYLCRHRIALHFRIESQN